ncbi:MAG TPA: hypothetical protein VGB55_04120 [Tepidisphaeraceae bacterium]|jgi:excinuclease UvrABC nuclease subunit
MDRWCDDQLSLDPAVPLDVAARALPARWAVYLMRDEAGRPVQLLSVRNLRASVKRRLGEPVEPGVSKRIDYRSLVRQICWKRVDSAFESDLVYLQVAKDIFPDSYQRITHWRRPWFVNIDLSARFPRWLRTDEPDAAAGELFGPIAEKGQAQKLVETIEDLFDLCRYYHILQQAPSGVACPYKDMGKCPAPCDGSVSMQQYQQLLTWSLKTLRNPQPEIDSQGERMKTAAAELRFELAGKIKQFSDGLGSLRKGDWRFVRPLADFRYLSLQRGPSKGTVKLFSVTPAGSTCVACLLREPRELMLYLNDLPALQSPVTNTTVNSELLNVACKHLFWNKSGGVFLHGSDLTERSIATACRQLSKQAPSPAEADEENDDEGVVAELHS